MNHFRLLPSLMLFSAILCTFPPRLRAQAPLGTLHGMVVNVSDGDHLTVNNDGTELFVRLYGIDAPEITKVRRYEPLHSKLGQPYAGKAFMALSNKVLHRQVTLEIMRIDHHERVVAIVFLDDRNINLEMAEAGWAWASRTGRNRPDDPEYQKAEEHARAAKTGLWSQVDPVPPWEFRKLRKMEDLVNW